MLFEYMHSHAQSMGHYAPWLIAGSLMLAGLNVPLSADIIILCAALLAAAMPEKLFILYGSVFFGCLFSAWIAHTLGKLLGPKLLTNRFFSSILTEERITKAKNFYNKHGFLTLLICRFIPFGARNCLFMSTGIAKIPFKHFAIRDALACLIWSSLVFTLFYLLAEQREMILSHLKIFNLCLFSAFSVTGIAVVWYKRRKKTQAKKMGA